MVGAMVGDAMVFAAHYDALPGIEALHIVETLVP